jgi:glutaredoxin
MGKIFKAALFAAGVYLALLPGGGQNLFDKNIAAQLAPGNQVVMYSLTTCPYCRDKREWMHRAGIPFTEYFVDSDQSKRQELNELMATHRIPAGGVGTPILLVNGDLLVNNPGKDEIRQRLKFKS